MNARTSVREAGRQREGPVARAIEKRTAQLPSDTFLWLAIGSIAGSIAFKAAGRNGPALFIGQWVPTFLILGLYNKLVKVAGSDRTERRKEEHASADFGFNVP
jgi:hypothetical protein